MSVVPLRWCQHWWHGNLSVLYFNPPTQADKHKHSFTPPPSPSSSSSCESPTFFPEIFSRDIAANSPFNLLNSEFYCYFRKHQQPNNTHQTCTKSSIFAQVKVTWRNQKQCVMRNICRDPYPYFICQVKQSKAIRKEITLTKLINIRKFHAGSCDSSQWIVLR